MSAAKQPPAKLAESIPAVTAPVKLPRLTPSRASYLANLITGAALIVLCLAGLIYGVTL